MGFDYLNLRRMSGAKSTSITLKHTAGWFYTTIMTVSSASKARHFKCRCPCSRSLSAMAT